MVLFFAAVDSVVIGTTKNPLSRGFVNRLPPAGTGFIPNYFASVHRLGDKRSVAYAQRKVPPGDN